MDVPLVMLLTGGAFSLGATIFYALGVKAGLERGVLRRRLDELRKH